MLIYDSAASLNSVASRGLIDYKLVGKWPFQFWVLVLIFLVLRVSFTGVKYLLLMVEKEHNQEKISESWHLNGKSSATIDWLEITDYLQFYTMNALLIITQEVCDLLQFIPRPIVFAVWNRLVLKFYLNIQEDCSVAAAAFICPTLCLSFPTPVTRFFVHPKISGAFFYF